MLLVQNNFISNRLTQKSRDCISALFNGQTSIVYGVDYSRLSFDIIIDLMYTVNALPESSNGFDTVLGFSMFQINNMNEQLCSRTFKFRKVVR